jgi:hypothetical protein
MKRGIPEQIEPGPFFVFLFRFLHQLAIHLSARLSGIKRHLAIKIIKIRSSCGGFDLNDDRLAVLDDHIQLYLLGVTKNLYNGLKPVPNQYKPGPIERMLILNVGQQQLLRSL